MPATIVTTINSHLFSSELSELIFRPDRTEVDFKLVRKDGTHLLETVYYPDLSGTVVAYGINRILDDDIKDGSTQDYKIIIDGVISASFTAFRCPIAMEIPAQQFLFRRFMTSVKDERDTAVGRHECLSVYNPEGLPLTVEASYLTYDGVIAKKQFSSISTQELSGGISYYNVSPILFNDFSTGELIGLVVECGARTQRYRVLMSPPHHDPAIIFRNCFNCWETIFLCGKKETDVEFTRSVALVNGKYLNYDLDEVITYKASTGPMRNGSDRLARDLARSTAVFLLRQDGTPGDRITITDCDVKTDNSDDKIPSFSFTFRKASLLSTDFEAPELYRIFDNTFDLSYE